MDFFLYIQSIYIDCFTRVSELWPVDFSCFYHIYIKSKYYTPMNLVLLPFRYDEDSFDLLTYQLHVIVHRPKNQATFIRGSCKKVLSLGSDYFSATFYQTHFITY